MIEIERPQALTRLRRHVLASQGLLQAQPFGRGLAGARKAVNHLGYVQVDSISVVERAHHHVLYARVPDFTPAMTNTLLVEGDIFEYWAHAAAFLPISDFRFSLPYKHAIKSGQAHWYRNPDRKLMRELLERIRLDGPMRSRDTATSKKHSGGWWNWKPAKKALEQLYMQGDLMVSDRTGFQKTYDLTERVLPSHVDTTMPGMEALAVYLLNQQLRSQGVVSLKGVTYQRRNAELRKTVKALVDERLTQGDLEQVRLNRGDVFLIEAGALERPMPRVHNRMQILSPFDNSVIQRERLSAIFHYDYQIECYVPAAKRQYGYFSLPLLYRDTFMGRMDCKAHRKERLLEIKSLYLEQHGFDKEPLLKAFVRAIQSFCQFQECDQVRLIDVHSKSLENPLRRALK